MATVVYIDGLAQPRNPGLGTYAFVIYEDDVKVAEDGGLAGDPVTNNFAEYCALVMALKRLSELGKTGPVTVRSDSKLLVGQMSQGWKVKGGGYLEKLKEARELVKEMESVAFEWVPREQNQEADLLSRVAYEKQRRAQGR